MNKKPIPRSLTSRLLAAGALVASTFLTTLHAADPEPVLDFDGVESIIQTTLSPEALGIDQDKPRTIEAWVYTRAFGEHGVFHLGTSTGGQEFALRTDGLNDRWKIQCWGPDIQFVYSGTGDAWAHFAITYDGSQIRAFVNGQEAMDPVDADLTTTGGEWDFRIGAWRNRHFDGKIRDVRIWNLARTQAEIQATLNDTSSFPTAGLVAWWPLNEGEGRVAHDESGNGYDAPIFGAQWESQQFDYDPAMTADIDLDFGTGTGKVDASSLVRNRADHFTPISDALRMTATTGNFISSSAAASVTNYTSGQDFTLESEVYLPYFPEPRASRFGFLLLGRPHLPPEDPFNTAEEEDFYAVSFFPSLPTADLNSMFPVIEPTGDGTAVIAISHGFNGPYITAQRWNGSVPTSGVLFTDDFEDPATDTQWEMGGTPGTWGIGEVNDTHKPDPLEGSTRVAGTSLDTEIPAEVKDDYLRTPVIDLTDVSSASISFTEALYLDYVINQETGEPYHTATVSVVTAAGEPIAGGQVAQYWANSGNFGQDWRDQTFLLPEAAYGQPVRIEFRINTDDFTGDGVLYGWMIDDVEVSGWTPGEYLFTAEGNHGFGGELELEFTVADLSSTEGYSQTLSTTFVDAIEGNLFGIGGRMQSSAAGDPTVDFMDFSMTLDETAPLVPTTYASAFYYPFGTTGTRVGTESFSLTAEETWTVQGDSLQVTQPDATSLAATRVRQFQPGNSIHVEADAVLSTLDATNGGQAGLVLFGEEDPAVFSAADSSTYYSFQYILADGASKIALREGVDGAILYEASVPDPVEGASYRFEFTGDFGETGDVEFTATLASGGDTVGTLTGVIADSFESSKLFGILTAQGGGDVWDFQNFGGYTARPLEANYQFYRWTVQDTRSSGSHQLAEFSFFFGGEDILAARRAIDPEDVPTVTGPNMGSANEHPGMLVDGDTGTKLFGGGGWAENPIVFNLGAPTPIDGYMLWTANDSDSRDPTGWTLEGSMDALHWNLIDIRSDVAAPTARFTRYLASGEFNLPTGAVLRGFAANGAEDGTIVTEDGVPVTLSWESEFATSVSIQPGIGQVAATGTLDIVVPEDAQTTYTLTAVGADGVPHTAEVTVVSTTPATRTFRYVRFELPSVEALRNPNSNSIQIQQFQFYLGDTEVVPVGVSNPGGNMPANEPISNLIVTGPGKWLDFNRATRLPDAIQSSYVVFDFGTSKSIDRYRFITGNDAPDRDPLRWKLWGRDTDTAAWTLIENVVSDYAVTTVRSTPTQTFPLPMNVTPTVGGIDYLAIDGLGAEAVTPRTVAIVEDGTTINMTWETVGTTSASLDPGPGDVALSDSLSFLPEQSASGTITLTATGDGGDGTDTVWVRSVPADHFETARYVRFDIPDNSALRNPNENSIQISEFRFFRDGVRVNPVEVTNPGGNNPTGGTQNPESIHDDDIFSKWLDFNKANLNDSHLVFDFGAEVEVDSYQFVTGGDATGRDPLRWRLYARNTPEEDWRMIENMPVNYPVTTDRNTATPIIPLPGIALDIPTALPLSDWLDEHFDGDDRTNPEISGLLADPAGDGVSNLLKYAFGLDPFTPVSSQDLPQAEIVDNTLRLTYVERIAATDITYTPQKSFTLTDGWNTDGIVEVGPRVAIDEEFELVTVELPLNAESRAFLRVQVTGGE